MKLKQQKINDMTVQKLPYYAKRLDIANCMRTNKTDLQQILYKLITQQPMNLQPNQDIKMKSMAESLMDVGDDNTRETKMMIDTDNKMKVDAEYEKHTEIPSTPRKKYFTPDIQVADPYELQQVHKGIERMKKLNKQFWIQ